MCPGIGQVEQLRFVCNIASEASCKYLSVLGDETRVFSVRERLRNDRGISREKKIR